VHPPICLFETLFSCQCSSTTVQVKPKNLPASQVPATRMASKLPPAATATVAPPTAPQQAATASGAACGVAAASGGTHTSMPQAGGRVLGGGGRTPAEADPEEIRRRRLGRKQIFWKLVWKIERIGIGPRVLGHGNLGFRCLKDSAMGYCLYVKAGPTSQEAKPRVHPPHMLCNGLAARDVGSRLWIRN
jgi:hypothetical protein